jgi:hypothetical protein
VSPKTPAISSRDLFFFRSNQHVDETSKYKGLVWVDAHLCFRVKEEDNDHIDAVEDQEDQEILPRDGRERERSSLQVQHCNCVEGEVAQCHPAARISVGMISAPYWEEMSVIQKTFIENGRAVMPYRWSERVHNGRVSEGREKDANIDALGQPEILGPTGFIG